MTDQEQLIFKETFDSIKYFTRELKDANDRITQLSRWDKNGSHTKAINLAIDDRKKIRKALTTKLDGKTYEEWLAVSKKLSYLNSRLNRAKEAQKRIEVLINNLQP